MSTIDFIILYSVTAIAGLSILWRVASDHCRIMDQTTERWEKK